MPINRDQLAEAIAEANAPLLEALEALGPALHALAARSGAKPAGRGAAGPSAADIALEALIADPPSRRARAAAVAADLASLIIKDLPPTAESFRTFFGGRGRASPAKE